MAEFSYARNFNTLRPSFTQLSIIPSARTLIHETSLCIVLYLWPVVLDFLFLRLIQKNKRTEEGIERDVFIINKEYLSTSKWENV